MWHPHVKAVQSSFRSTRHDPDSLHELRIYGHVHSHIHFLLLLVKFCIWSVCMFCKMLRDIKQWKKEFYDQNILDNAGWNIIKRISLSQDTYLSAFHLPIEIVIPQERGCGAQHFPHSFDHRISFSRISQYKPNLALSENQQQRERWHYFFRTGHPLSETWIGH